MKKTALVLSICALVVTACSKPAEKTQENTTLVPVTATTPAPAEQASVQKNLPTGDNAETSLSWDGEYKGVFPCADCEGIKTELELNSDKTYELTEKYLGKGNQKETKIKGKFEFDKIDSSIINLDQAADDQRFFVGENTLSALARDTGKPIDGPNAEHYVLKKDLH